MTQSYSSLFGTNGSGTQNRIGNMFGQQRRPPATEGTAQAPARPMSSVAPAPTFAQMQSQGQARPAPATPPAPTYGTFQGSQQANAVRPQMLAAVQQQLAQPTRFDTQAFQQMRAAQQANMGAEFGAQRSQLEEEMARRGLSASSIAAGRYGDLAGQQARATADLDAQLLQAAAQTQAQDRLAALQGAGQFAELAGAQDLQSFLLGREGQQMTFEDALRSAQFGQGQREFDLETALRERLGLGELDVRTREANANIAMQQNQLMLQLAQALGGLSPAMLAQLFGNRGTGTGTLPPNAPPGPPTSSPPGGGDQPPVGPDGDAPIVPPQGPNETLQAYLARLLGTGG